MHSDVDSLIIEVDQSGRLDRRRYDPHRRRPLKIGALASADIRIDGPGVARIHAVLSVVGREVYVVAMDTRAGLEVNGVPTQRAAVGAGDVIRIGAATLRLSRAEEPTAERAAPALRPVASPAAPEPRFDPGLGAAAAPSNRVTRKQLRRPTVENRPHPALPPESPVTSSHRALELRTYMGQALLDMHHYVGRREISIGESRAADVFLSSEGLPTQVFPLLRADGDDTILTFTSDMEGEIELDGEIWTLAELLERGRATLDPELPGSFQLALNLSTRALVHWGGVTFAMRFVAPVRPVPANRFINLDHSYLNTLALSVALHSTLILTLMLSPYDARALEEQEFADATLTLYHPTGIAPVPFVEPKPARRPPEPPATRKPAPGGGARAPRRISGRTAAEIRERIEQVLAGEAGSLLAGDAPLSSGLDIDTIGSRGQRATGGLLLGGRARSFGPMVGGVLGRPRGEVIINTRPCLGSADCDGLSPIGPPRTASLREFGILGTGEPVVEKGALPKDVIRRVINRSKGQIRACYERELQRDHDLAGKVAVKFIIGATGGVVRAVVVENDMGNRAVAQCIRERIQSWRFPPPAGGGVVEVNYPFVFHAI